MVKHESRNVERTNGDRDVRSAEQPRCVELSAFELELIAGGSAGAGNGFQLMISVKR